MIRCFLSLWIAMNSRIEALGQEDSVQIRAGFEIFMEEFVPSIIAFGGRGSRGDAESAGPAGNGRRFRAWRRCRKKRHDCILRSQ